MRRFIAAAVLAVTCVTPAYAIEMFTNFNNGTELGTRPLGIPELAPVRFHAYPMWRGGSPCEFQGPSSPAEPINVPAGAPAAPLDKGTSGKRADGSAADRDDWGRRASFLPANGGN
jgi:hypothetical protein